ncbi:MAG: HlyC/CorC family transporter [Firmicutes bacterium]|nr:HlyC/CorC family transporter [Bacillota bacterium]
MDSEMLVSIILLVILLFLSGFFSSAETALISANKIRIRTLSQEGNKRAKIVLRIFENPDKMLSAILIGNNLVNTFSASIAATIAYSFGGAWVSITTFIITLLILIFGEITPKTLATQNAEKISLLYAPVINFLMLVFTPIILFINGISKVLLKIFGVEMKQSGPSLTENELRTIVDVSHEEGVIEEDEKDMIKNVFDLGDVRAKDVMVPRVHVSMLEVSDSYKDIIELFKEEQYTRIPIYEDTIDNIVGLINMKDLILIENDQEFSIRKYMRKPYFVFENKKVSDLLLEMKQSTINLAIVLDEYGELAGIITLEDIIEEIVGEVRDEYDGHEALNIQKINERLYKVKGYLSLHDLNEALDLNLNSEDYDSVGGLVIDALGHFPVLKDQIELEDGTILRVSKIIKNRIEEVYIVLPKNEEEE